MPSSTNIKVAERGLVDIVMLGYPEAPEAAMFMYDLRDLNKENIDFKSIKIKDIVQKVRRSEDGQKIVWYRQDLKEALVNVNTATSATSVAVDTSGILAGEQLFNQTTGETAVVQSVSGTTLTLVSPGFVGSGYAANNKLFRVSFAKRYGVADSKTITRPDAVDTFNWFQYTERTIGTNTDENNANYLFYTPQERAQAKYGDVSRNIIKDIIFGFYANQRDNTNDRRAAGGLSYFIPSSAKADLNPGGNQTATVIKANLHSQLKKAYQSGLSIQSGRLLAICNSAFSYKIGSLYEDFMHAETLELTSIGIQIEKVNINGFHLNVTRSNTLDTIYGDTPKCFLVPIDYAGMVMLPNGIADATAKGILAFGKGYVYPKAQVTGEVIEHGINTAWSYQFQGVESGAFRELSFS